MGQSADPLAAPPLEPSPHSPKPSRGRFFLVAVLVLVVLGAGAVAAVSRRPAAKRTAGPTPSPAAEVDMAAIIQKGKRLSDSACLGSGVTPLTTLPMKLGDVGYVLPMGAMSGTQVTPDVSQRYVGADVQAAADSYSVSAPGDGMVVDIRHSQAGNPQEYRILIAYSCTFFEYIDSLSSLDPALKLMLPEEWNVATNTAVAVPVKAGQRLGGVGGQGIALGIWDLSHPLPGLSVPLAYSSKPGKLYAAAPGDYYQSDLADQIVAKYLRSVHPIEGKLDYDREGAISGNWFLAGSNGEAGKNPAVPWVSQVSFAYDSLDPVIPVISLGDVKGQPGQFLAKANGPDPAKIDAVSGLVKYELVPLMGYQDQDGALWDEASFAQNLVPVGGTPIGTLLVQLLESHKLRVELVPDKTPDQATAFSSAALTYDRGDSAKDETPAY